MPSTPQTVGPYEFQGCYHEATSGGRAIGEVNGTPSTKSVDGCEDFCNNAAGGPYTYFAVEYYGECYCGNSLNPSSQPGATTCNTLCDGNQLQYCGGAAVLGLYKRNAAASSLSSSSTAVAGTSASSTYSPTTTITSCVSTVQRCLATHTECIGVATQTNCLATITETQCLATVTRTSTVSVTITAA